MSCVVKRCLLQRILRKRGNSIYGFIDEKETFFLVNHIFLIVYNLYTDISGSAWIGYGNGNGNGSRNRESDWQIPSIFFLTQGRRERRIYCFLKMFFCWLQFLFCYVIPSLDGSVFTLTYLPTLACLPRAPISISLASFPHMHAPH